MTKEEAINELTDLLPEEYLMDYAEAIKMGIEALEQEPCGDVVNRQAVIDAIEDDNRNGHYSCFATNNDAECFKQIIRELPSVTLMPCEDAISRQAVIDTIDKWIKSMHVLIALPANEVTPLFESVYELPSVTPQPKVGHWVKVIEENGHAFYLCSVCKEGTDENYDWCPFCGCKMQEVEG